MLDGSVLDSVGYIANIWRGNLLITILQVLLISRHLTGIALIGVMMIFPLSFFALFASIHGVAQILSQIVGFVYILLL